MRRFLFVLPLLVSFCGCRHSSICSKLDEISSWLPNNPDSALLVLKDIGGLHQRLSDAEESKLLLLTVKARNLTDVGLDSTDEVKMQRAMPYYISHGTAHEQMEANYLFGSVYRDMNDAPQAQKYFLLGMDVADTLSPDFDYILFMKICGHYGDLLLNQGLENQALEVYERGYRYAEKEHNVFYSNLMKNSMLTAMNAGGYYTALVEQADSLVESYFQAGDTVWGAQWLISAVFGSQLLQKNDTAGRLLSLYEQYSKEVDPITHISTNPIYYCVKGRHLLYLGKNDSAMMFFRRELAVTDDWYNKQMAYEGISRLYELEGNLDSALYYDRLLYDAQTGDFNDKVSKQVLQLAAAYDYARHETAANQAKMELMNKERMWILSASVLLVSVLSLSLVLWIVHSRYREHILKMEAEDAELRASLEHTRSLITQLQMSSLHPTLTELGSMRSEPEVIELNDFNKHRGKIKQILKNRVFSGKIASAEDWEEIQFFMVHYYDAFIQRLYTSVEHLSLLELHVCYLLLLDLIPKEISILTAKSISAITNIRTRLYAKAHGGAKVTAAEADEWIRSL